MSVLQLLKGRSPLGERGLKFTLMVKMVIGVMSLSAWRAWIEILLAYFSEYITRVALRLESVD